MPERVVRDKEISINGNLYQLARDVQFFLASQQPGKVALGEYFDETNPLASSITWNNFRRGIGLEVMDVKVPEHQSRAWYSTCTLRHQGQIVLGRLATTTTQAAAFDVQLLAEFRNEIYAPHSTTVYLYNASVDTWSSVRTLLNNATDWAVGLLGTTQTLVIATGSEVDYATDSSTWNRNTTDIEYVTFFENLLWGIDNAGQLYYTDNLAQSWTTDAQLPLPPDYATKLLVARGPDREQHLYCVTKVGLFVHDKQGRRFVPTDLELPFHPRTGPGAGVFRGRIVIPAGNSIYSFQAGSDRTDVTTIGPDRDHGLPSTRRGSIVQVAKSHNELLAAVGPITTQGTWNVSTWTSGGFGSHRMGIFNAGTGRSLLLGWDELGWQVLWESAADTRPITAMLVSNAYSQYRLWWAQNQRVYYMPLPVDVINPVQVSTTTYASSGTIETPWFDAGTPNQAKLALSVVVETSNPSSSETVQVEYATNYSESYTSLGTITTGGETRYYLGTNRAGLQFRAWKFRITLARGSTTTSSPTLRLISLHYRKRIRTLYGAEAFLDVSEKSPDGISPRQQMTNLRAAVNNGTLIEVVWRNNTGNTENYYMDPVDLRSVENSGDATSSLVLFRALEPEQSTSR